MGNLAQAKKLRAKLGLEKDKAGKGAVTPAPKPLDKQNREELIVTAKALGIEIKDETKAQIVELIKAVQK